MSAMSPALLHGWQVEVEALLKEYADSVECLSQGPVVRRQCEVLKGKIGALLKDPDIKAAAAASVEVKQDWKKKSQEYNKLNLALQRAGHQARDEARKAAPAENGDTGSGEAQQQVQFDKRKLVLDSKPLEHMEDIAKERDDEIRQIAEGVEDIAEMMKDCNRMVADQGKDIDTVETLVEKTQANVADGTVELKKARKHQGKCAVM